MNESDVGKKAKKKLSRIFLLIVVVLVACFIWIMAASTFIDRPGDQRRPAYNVCKENLQNAVQHYQDNNSEILPTLNGTVTINGSVYQILDVCSLLASQGGLLRVVPDGIWCGNGSADDNCDSGCVGCSNTSHYIWAVDSNGSVYSTCVGNGCKANGQDSYQGVWP